MVNWSFNNALSKKSLTNYTFFFGQFDHRHQLQVSGSLSEGSEGVESNGIGNFLGWGMAAIYMGARLPQIFLNVRIYVASKYYIAYILKHTLIFV